MNGLVQRKDLVMKKVLRGMKRYYWKGFNSLTKYQKKKNNSVHCDFYISCLKKYINYEFQMETSDGLISVFEDLFRKNKLKPDGSLNEVHSLLYKYRDKKLKIMTKNSDFRNIILNYYDKAGASLLTNDEESGLDIAFDECFA